MLSSIGQKLGARANVETYTEITFTGQKANEADRPDGLIDVRIGKRSWRALVEAKVGNNELSVDQIERYRSLAKNHAIDCVITISNQFTSMPQIHPLPELRKTRSRVPIYHWSWMFILTQVDLLLGNEIAGNSDQAELLRELRRFLSHESAGVKGFSRMPPEWSDLNKLVSSGGKIQIRAPEAMVVIQAWHQETRDLSLILSRQTKTTVVEKLSRSHAQDPQQRIKDELSILNSKSLLTTTLEIPDAASQLTITADLTRRTIDAGMSLRAPLDKKTTKARLNWLLRQIKSDNVDDLVIKLNWPGKSASTHFPFRKIMEDISIANEGKEHLQITSFDVFYSRRLGIRFVQQANFISELERLVPEFYREIGQDLIAWRRPAPKIGDDSDLVVSSDVSDDRDSSSA
ncbi:MAG: hypothetical protein GXP05_04310 [Alphaproteobacteria bacterium]|nr:hypothetical protein [Alphaproteobacteria bacterium]